jgi:hypothetical protein
MIFDNIWESLARRKLRYMRRGRERKVERWGTLPSAKQ